MPSGTPSQTSFRGRVVSAYRWVDGDHQQARTCLPACANSSVVLATHFAGLAGDVGAGDWDFDQMNGAAVGDRIQSQRRVSAEAFDNFVRSCGSQTKKPARAASLPMAAIRP